MGRSATSCIHPLNEHPRKHWCPDAWGLATPATRLAAVTLQAAWLIPYEPHLHWMVPAASVVLLVPSFIVSIWLERWVLRRRWPERDRPTVNRTVWIANIASYALLFVAGSVWFGISKQSNQSPHQELQSTQMSISCAIPTSETPEAYEARRDWQADRLGRRLFDRRSTMLC